MRGSYVLAYVTIAAGRRALATLFICHFHSTKMLHVTKQISFFAIKGEKKKRGRSPESQDRIAVSKKNRPQGLFYTLPIGNYLSRFYSIFVCHPLLMWLHIEWLCLSVQNCSQVTFKIWHPAKGGGQWCHSLDGLDDFISEIELWEQILSMTLEPQ